MNKYDLKRDSRLLVRLAYSITAGLSALFFVLAIVVTALAASETNNLRAGVIAAIACWVPGLILLLVAAIIYFFFKVRRDRHEQDPS